MINNYNSIRQIIAKQKKFKVGEKGSSLIEVLVTLLIMAIGLLGLASIQTLSLKNLNNTQFRSLATVYAYDMAERMRSNHAAVLAGNYDAITATVSDPNCSSCTVSQIAQLDAYQWNEIINQAIKNGGLPEGRGTVTKSGDVFNITVIWEEQQRDSTGGHVTDTDFTLTIQL